MPNTKFIKNFEKVGLSFGRMVGGSKRLYGEENPDNFVIFNARIYDKKTFEKHKNKKIKDFFAGQEDEIWYGDLDLNKDINLLKTVAYEIGNIVVSNETGNKVIEINSPFGKI